MYKLFFKISSGILIFMLSCQQKTNTAVTFEKINNQKILICDVDKISETREMKLSELVESVDVVRLENKPEAFVGRTWLREVSNNYIFLADIQNRLMLFSPEGKFIKTWNSGRGPSEFIIPEQPQIVGNNVYVNDTQRGNLLNYSLDDKPATTIKAIKQNGNIRVLENSKLLSIGISKSEKDPLLVCLQDFNGNVLQSIKASSHLNLTPPVVGEGLVAYSYNNGWNVHFPTNDTLKHYDVVENTLKPLAIFYSKSHIENNKKFFMERQKAGLNIQNKDLTKVVKVVPEYESDRYHFLSIYHYGEKKDLPWYFPTLKMCLVDKETKEVFYINLINDFWGDIPFTFQGNRKSWSENIIQDFPAIAIKEKFTKLLSEKGDQLDNSMRQKIEELIAETNEDDNNLIFRYKLKQ